MAAVAQSAFGERPMTPELVEKRQAYVDRMAALAAHLRRVNCELLEAKSTCSEMESLERTLHDKGVSLSRPNTAQERPRPPFYGAAAAAAGRPGSARPASANGPSRPCTPQELALEVGARCFHRGRFGTVAFLGAVHYADGDWCGIVMDDPVGKNDGTIKGTPYFRCAPKHGIIVKQHECMRADNAKAKASLKLSATAAFGGR